MLVQALPGAIDWDGMAADHQHLFGFNVFPYAGVFLDPDGRLNGPVADEVRQVFLRSGCPLPLTGESLDHLGHELAWLAHMMHAEAEALQDGIAAEVRRIRWMQRRFLDHHLLGWLPLFLEAARGQASPFFRRLLDLTQDVVWAHRRALGPAPPEEATPFTLPAPPALLDLPETGLKEIAGYLATPVWAGFFLGRDDIGALGRRIGVPCGFGNRQQMLVNLVRAAAEYDRLVHLVAALKERVAVTRAGLRDLVAGDLPGLREALTPWLERLETTDRLLDRVRGAAQERGRS
ncbi:molecular chaperone TorD family protein [Rhodocaloribacter litoris]|nr:molecular chaperone TorD family protein [Rhodocaloribacter litoris]QXD16257.1 molecular chaperone TorD family protein [Rhodocaloribacter litoris]GIV60750.1 MAG: dehydrogenase [Rhodothermaceae bacterium]